MNSEPLDLNWQHAAELVPPPFRMAEADEPCVCDTDFSCCADVHDKGRCDACAMPGIYELCCVDHQARMCGSCADANHGGES